MKKSKIIKLLTGVLIVAVAFTGCASKGSTTSATVTAEKTAAPKTIIVGTSGTFKPYTYLDDSGKVSIRFKST